MATEEDRLDAEIAQMFGEVKEVHVEMVNGKPRVAYEETIAQMDAQEMEIDRRPGVATDPKLEVEWWRRLDALGLADGSLKERFLGRDRSPASVRQYAKFRRKMVLGERYRTDA